MRRLAPLIVAVAACAPVSAAAARPPTPVEAAQEQRMAARLASAMRHAGRRSGAYVVNATDGRVAFHRRHRAGRILASNAKLFTTAAALARLGPEEVLRTEVLGRGRLRPNGTWRGSLYLRGGGDPTFGSRRFARRAYGGGAAVEDLAEQLEEAGIARVTGRVLGDESRFDSLRGGPDSGFETSIWVGPLSALSYNRGLADERGSSFQSNPPLFAAARLDAALERRGIRVRRGPRTGRTPPGAEPLASVESPPVERLVQIANKASDNFFAEMLLKGIAVRARGRGTTRAGTRAVERLARRLGARVHLADGSGLSRANRTSPYRVVRLLLAMRWREGFEAFLDSLAVAGRDGTLAERMERGPARRRCRAKTGTLSNVSALSGYCRARSGDVYAFSILMNRVHPTGARALQDRMARAIAAVRDRARGGGRARSPAAPAGGPRR